MPNISGTSGADTFQFLSTSDSYTGGAGADTYVISQLWYPETGTGALFNTDTITDFSLEDRLYFPTAVAFAVGAFNGIAGEIRYEKINGKTVIQSDGNGDGSADATLTLSNGEFDIVHVGSAMHAIAGTPTAGSDVLAGSAAANAILGLDGNDLIEGRDGNDEIHGGNGDDALFGEFNLNSNNAGDDTIYGDDGNDLLVGGRGSDKLYGGAGNDVLASGNDVANGYDVTTSSWSGSWYYGDGGNDVIDGGDGSDMAILTFDRVAGITVDISNPTSVASILADGVAIGSITKVERLTFAGGSGADAVTGGSSADGLFGYGGQDVLQAGAGNDLLAGGEGNDTLNGGDGDDTIMNGVTDKTLYTPATDQWAWTWYLTDGGDDIINGGNGTDLAVLSFERAAAITVDISNPAIVSSILANGTAIGSITNVERLIFAGGSGADVVAGGALNDSLYGNDGNDILNGGLGSDTSNYWTAPAGVVVDLRISTAQNTVNAGSDTLISIENLGGSSFGDTLTGNAGTNLLFGFGGEDTLEGGAGDDFLDGGADTDTAVYSGTLANYTLSRNADGSIVVTDTRSGSPDGLDTLWSVEILKFAGSMFDVATLPLIQPVADQSSLEDSAWTYTVPAATFADAHGDPLAFDARLAGGAALPSWLAYNAATRTFSGTPPANFNGSLEIMLTTTTSTPALSDSFRLTITPVNDPPTVASSFQAFTANSGQARTFAVIANDVDGDTLTWTAGAAQHGAIAGGAGGSFTYTANAGYSGTDTFAVTVSDGHGGTATQTVNVTVIIGSSTHNTGVFLGTSDHVELASGQLKVFGTSGSDTVVLQSGVRDVTMDQNVDTIFLPGPTTAYKFQQLGNQLAIIENNETVLTVPVQRDADGTVLVFANGTASATAVGASMWVGGAPVPGTAPEALAPSLTSVLAKPQGATSAQAFLGLGEQITAAIDGLKVYGSSGLETLVMNPGASGIIADQAVDGVSFSSGYNEYAYHQTGNRINVWDKADTELLLTIPVQGDANGTHFSFAGQEYSAILISGTIQFSPVFG